MGVPTVCFAKFRGSCVQLSIHEAWFYAKLLQLAPALAEPCQLCAVPQALLLILELGSKLAVHVPSFAVQPCSHAALPKLRNWDEHARPLSTYHPLPKCSCWILQHPACLKTLFNSSCFVQKPVLRTCPACGRLVVQMQHTLCMPGDLGPSSTSELDSH